MTAMDVRFELFVSDTAKSVDFYKTVLGFTELQSFGDYRPIKCGNVTIGISPITGLKADHYFRPEIASHRKGLGIEIVLEVDDIDAAYAHAQQSSYDIFEQLQQREWGLRDFRLVDPDGNYLRITSRN